MSDKAMIYVHPKEKSASLESSQDVCPPLESSTGKEQLSGEPIYAVEKYHDKDDAGYVATWKKRLHALLPLSSVIAITAYWLYFTFRVRYTLALQRVDDTVFPVAWIFLATEVGIACETSPTPRIPFA